jgi:diguanylate cyclase (GGDEF)-like protein
MALLRVLLVEDSDDDALLLTRQLKRHADGAMVERVDTLEALERALQAGTWDVVISDYSLQGFDGLAALAAVRRRTDPVPFILVSATVGEDVAVGAMRAGASDYMMKNRLERLLPAVEREVRETRARREQATHIAHLGRVRAVTGAATAAMLRVREREELYREACSIAVEHGSFPMAWLLAEEGGRLRVAASQGVPEGTLPALEDAGSSLGAFCAQVAKSGQAQTWNDVSRDAPTHVAGPLLARGVHSLLILPLVVPDAFTGALGLGAPEAGFFDEQELRLLRELAADIAFTLDHIGQRERLDHLAYFDTVTGLANRRLFVERLGPVLESARTAGHAVAIAVVDIERFAEVNATFGRHVGDALLRSTGARLAAAHGEARVARIGANEFGVAITATAGESDATRAVSESLTGILDTPIEFDGQEVRRTARVGATLFPADGDDAATLLRNAEAAAARAKATKESVLFYDAAMTTRVAGRLRLEGQLRRALERGEFELHYQPKVRAADRRIVGAEALLRWRSPDSGMVSPARFIPMLEETGQIVEVGDWVMRHAAKEVRRWRSIVPDAPRCAVNVSVRQLQRADFTERVSAALGGGDPEIDLEIVESLAMADPEACIAKLAAVNRLGVRVFIDDFGTGYSSLAYLARFPVQGLKIDRAFVAAMLRGGQARTLVATIIAMAHALGLDVVAEGVETDDQARALGELGCHELQGYLTGRPMPADAFAAALGGPRDDRRECSGIS